MFQWWKELSRTPTTWALVLFALSTLQTTPLVSGKLVEVLQSIDVEPEITMADLLAPGGRYHNHRDLHKLADEYRSTGNTGSGCYDKTIGNKTVNIFRIKLKDVVTQYLSNSDRKLNDFIEIQRRVKILIENLLSIAKLVQDCSKLPPLSRTKYGLSSMSLMSPNEFQRSLNPSLFNSSKITLRSGTSKCKFDWKHQIPDAFDWRTLGVVTPAKNQHTCGSCYIFAAIGALEAAVKRQLRKQKDPNYSRVEIEFSEQGLLNCLPAGCNGAELSASLQHLADVGAVPGFVEKYLNRPDTCNKYQKTFKADDYCYIVGDLNNDKLKVLLLKYGPITVGIDTPSSMQHLRGAFNTVDQCKPHPNHAVLLVGWTNTHWIIKNSWSRQWAQDGYLYLRITENSCAVTTLAGVVILNRPI